jgi:hypothetical protein
VLQQGRIVQLGTHDELLRDDGPYRSAALHQMADAENRRQLAEEWAQADGAIAET